MHKRTPPSLLGAVSTAVWRKTLMRYSSLILAADLHHSLLGVLCTEVSPRRIKSLWGTHAHVLSLVRRVTNTQQYSSAAAVQQYSSGCGGAPWVHNTLYPHLGATGMATARLGPALCSHTSDLQNGRHGSQTATEWKDQPSQHSSQVDSRVLSDTATSVSWLDYLGKLFQLLLCTARRPILVRHV